MHGIQSEAGTEPVMRCQYRQIRRRLTRHHQEGSQTKSFHGTGEVPPATANLKPSGTTIFLIMLSELVLKQGAFSVSIPHLKRDQADQEKQYVPAVYRKRNPANSQIDKHVHGVL